MRNNGLDEIIPRELIEYIEINEQIIYYTMSHNVTPLHNNF